MAGPSSGRGSADSGPEAMTGHRAEAFTPSQHRQLLAWQADLARAGGWSGDLPVVVHERCWLRLRAVPVGQLARQWPPDCSAEAPELSRYRERLQTGEDPWLAELHCWEEFGQLACQQALRTYWQQQTRSPGWTLATYQALLARYRQQMERSAPRSLPLLQLARPYSPEPHRLLWLKPPRPSMRHTCA
ncbi:hypothetical protein IQ216_08285 [Cyanobium sp. LEGE 06143]|uniref:hypothetical protein n=1 Tax=Cyanobium sp. LEGE 06143 TaxID=945727 RepID=UPI00187EB600|nr:hypothetical protein [Cyanobium sp. LEGE 06143]MBE9173079.1 hypothetical protein [Cyanobium sp. LEGE 06143]